MPYNLNLIAIFLFTGISRLYSQSVNEVYAFHITPPNDILLKLPAKARFTDGEFPDIYSLKNGYFNDTVNLNLGKIFNPHITTNLTSEKTEIQFEANYLSKASNKKYTFKFISNDVNSYDNNLKILDSIIFLPNKWKETLANDSIFYVIFICYSRIDSKGFPIEKRDWVRPYLLVTKNKVFNISLNLPSSIDYNLFKNYSTNTSLQSIYSGKINDCNQNDLYKKYISILKDKVIKKLEIAPFLALLSTDFSIPSDEIWLKRQYQRSLILGSPNFENTTYILRFITSADNSNSLNFYIVQSLAINTGLKGDYIEPDEKIVSKYKIAISEMVTVCIRETCEELHLKFTNNTCNCK